MKSLAIAAVIVSATVLPAAAGAFEPQYPVLGGARVVEAAMSTGEPLPPVVAQQGNPGVLPLAGSTIDVLVDSAGTGGAFSVVIIGDQPGGGPMPMIHGREAETFYVLEGQYHFIVGDTSYDGGPGTIVVNPQGVQHSFKVLGNAPGKLLAIYTPGGFENFFRSWIKTGANTPAAIGALEKQAGIVGSGVGAPQ